MNPDKIGATKKEVKLKYFQLEYELLIGKISVTEYLQKHDTKTQIAHTIAKESWGD